MNTLTVKSGTRQEILDYYKELRKTKHIAHNDEDIAEKLDHEIRQGHNLVHMDLTELENCKSGIGCWGKALLDDFFITDFNKEFIRLSNEERDNIELWRHRLESWEQIVKIERESEKRDAEYVRAMTELADKL